MKTLAVPALLLALVAPACDDASQPGPDLGPPRGDAQGLDAGVDAGQVDAGELPPEGDAGQGADLGPVDIGGAGGPVLVEVSHPRELRGAWIATVYNINFPSETGLSAAVQRQELSSILDRLAATGLNAAFFQVRPEGDAFYHSELEPWSRYLTGAQGRDPGYDPLGFLVDEAHRRGIEVHAWLNPYRAKASSGSTAVAPHVAVLYPEHAHVYDGALWMDPGASVVRERVVQVVTDIVRRYDVDGIHFDDYFYPYPDGTEFPDGASYAEYTASGGTSSRDDWRRENVHQLVSEVSTAIASERPDVRFGISPFGIYRPGIPPGITGLDQYAEIYSDPLRWMDEGWVDYLAPQLYWPTTQTAQAYEPLLDWWTSILGEGRSIFAGNYLSKLGTSSAWTVGELLEQVDISRRYADRGSRGNIFFHVGPILSDQSGFATDLRNRFYPEPALTPPIAAMRQTEVRPPVLSATGTTVHLGHESPTDLRGYVLYLEEQSGFAIQRFVPAAVVEVELSRGRWAVSAVGRHGVESLGVEIILP